MGVMLMKAHEKVAVVYRRPRKKSHCVSEALHSCKHVVVQSKLLEFLYQHYFMKPNQDQSIDTTGNKMGVIRLPEQGTEEEVDEDLGGQLWSCLPTYP
jgi:hypothetical protein